MRYEFGINFTGGRKIMNMAKLGTVSAAMNHPAKPSKPINHGLYSLIPYTLCVNRVRMKCYFKADYVK